MHRRRPALVLVVLVVLAMLGIIIGFRACRPSPPPPPPPPTSVELVTLTPTRVVDAMEYLATMISRTAATLQPQVDGQITAILVKPGDLVRAGQPLMNIDPGRQPAALSQARAARGARMAELALAEKNLQRVQYLVDTGALPLQELDNARTVVQAARADVAALGAQISGSQVELRYYTIVAPGQGVVGDIPVTVGERVTQQTVLTTVTDNTVLEANISIPVERAHDVAVGNEVEIADDRANVIGKGTVKFASVDVNSQTQSVLVKADIPNFTNALRAAQLVRARVVWRARPGLTVPALAVTRIGGQAFVYVAELAADRSLVARQRPVTLGALVNNQFVVEKGLSAGEQIITTNIQKVRDGAPIQRAARSGSGSGSGTPPTDRKPES